MSNYDQNVYVGDCVEDVGSMMWWESDGIYPFIGDVVAVFTTRSGRVRAVVEDADGVMRIFAPTALKIVHTTRFRAMMSDVPYRPAPQGRTPVHATTFDYHKPTDAQQQAMILVRSAAKVYADQLEQHIPEGPDKTYLMRKLREVAMWANVAVTRRPDGSPRDDEHAA